MCSWIVLVQCALTKALFRPYVGNCKLSWYNFERVVARTYIHIYMFKVLILLIDSNFPPRHIIGTLITNTWRQTITYMYCVHLFHHTHFMFVAARMERTKNSISPSHNTLLGNQIQIKFGWLGVVLRNTFAARKPLKIVLSHFQRNAHRYFIHQSGVYIQTEIVYIDTYYLFRSFCGSSWTSV